VTGSWYPGPVTRPTAAVALLGLVVIAAGAPGGCAPGEDPGGGGAGGRGGSGGSAPPAPGGTGGAGTSGGSGGAPTGAPGTSVDAASQGSGGGGSGAVAGDSGAGGAGGSGGATGTPCPLDGGAPEAAAPVTGAVVWNIDNLQRIGGLPTSIVGAPLVIETAAGKALQFDGRDDALFVEKHPLAGLPAFTVEVIFRPDSGGDSAQRLFHMQEDGSNGKVLFETRLFGDSFVADVFVESRAGEVALYAPEKKHPLNAWYNVTAVIDGKTARHYVNGVEEMSVNLGFTPQGPGRTSIGVRINRLYYFKGAIRQARFTPRALAPAEFLPPT
jgi:hypothetical protein